MEAEQRGVKTGFNATSDNLIIDKMVTQLYNKSCSHGWVSGWVLQPTALLVFWGYVNSLPLL